MVWLKRIIALVIILGIYPGYRFYQDRQHQQRVDEAERYALITARVWVATATMRDEPAEFIAWRDSLLDSTGISKDEIDIYMSRYEENPESYDVFARLVNAYVDSLIREATGVELPPVDSSAVEPNQ